MFIDQVLAPDQVVQIERERKVIVDAIKLTAYRTETSLARLVEPFFERHEEEARKLLKSIFKATADLVPDARARRLTVRFHGLASPRATRALSDLCALVNEQETVYPGTSLRLQFARSTIGRSSIVEGVRDMRTTVRWSLYVAAAAASLGAGNGVSAPRHDSGSQEVTTLVTELRALEKSDAGDTVRMRAIILDLAGIGGEDVTSILREYDRRGGTRRSWSLEGAVQMGLARAGDPGAFHEIVGELHSGDAELELDAFARFLALRGVLLNSEWDKLDRLAMVRIVA